MRQGQATVGLEFPALLAAGLQGVSQHTLLQVVEFVGIIFRDLLRGSLEQLVEAGMMSLDQPDDLGQRQPVHHQHFHENKRCQRGG